MSIVACMHPRPPVNAGDLARVERWWIVIGASPMLESLDWRHYARDAQMVVLSGDPRIPIGEFPRPPSASRYLSVGEADTAPRVLAGGADQPFLVEPNPDWPANVRVDIRDQRWQERLLREEIPPLIEPRVRRASCSTPSTPRPTWRRKDPARFAGLAAGAARLAAPPARDVSARGRSSRTAARRSSTWRRSSMASSSRACSRSMTLGTRDLPRHDRRGARLEAGRDRARAGGGAAAGVHDRVRRRRRRRAVALGVQDESIRHGFRPYVGCAI